MPRKKTPPTPPPDDLEDEDEDEDGDDDEDDLEDEDDDDGLDLDDDETDEDGRDAGGDEPEPEEGDGDEPPGGRPRSPPARSRPRRRVAGMGRPSTGPKPKAPEPVDVMDSPTTETEIVPDVSTWPGTAEAAKMVGRHTSTIKSWRTQGRVHAVQGADGCWRYNPDDLAEAMDRAEPVDPGQVLAQGMTAIVSQGASANERLLAMTEIATSGLKDATSVLGGELRQAYVRIRELEKERVALIERLSGDRKTELEHERKMRRLDQAHLVKIETARENSARIAGLLTIVGPIAASIGHRIVANFGKAHAAEAVAAGARSEDRGASPESPPSSDLDPRASTLDPSAGGASDMPLETRITELMARLCAAVRNVPEPGYQRLRALVPAPVQTALDTVRSGVGDSAVGQALAVLVKAAQALSDLQFAMMRPITPDDVAAILDDLRSVLGPPAPDEPEGRG